MRGAALQCSMLLLLAPVAAGAAPAPEAKQSVDADARIDALMHLLAQRRHGVADFQQSQYLGLLKQPLESSGMLLYDAPDHLEQRTLQPRAESLVIDHDVLSITQGRRHRSLALADYPQLAPWIEAMRATLAGDRAGLEGAFQLSFSGTLDHWQLQLVPHPGQLARLLLRIDIAGESGALQLVRIEQRNGDHAVLHIMPRE
jgi:hypothetical protein